MPAPPRPPGPKGDPLLGCMRQFQQDPLTFLADTADQYGDLSFFPLGPFKCYVVNRPEYIHEVLLSKTKVIQKHPFNQKILARAIGNSVLTSDGQAHQRRRKMLQPAFHSKRIESYARVMGEYTGQMLEEWRCGEQYDIKEEMSQLTMRIVGKTLFDVEVADEVRLVGDSLSVLQSHTVADFKRGFMFPAWLPTSANRQRKDARRQMDGVILRVIRKRRERFEDRGDLLSMLLAAQSEDDGRKMSEQELRDETTTLFLAGHETTSNALTWTWYLLSQNPSVEARMKEELDAVLNGGPPTLAELPKLVYTEMVLKESMRLLPPAWNLTLRTPIEPLSIGDYRIDPGTWLIISPYVMHRHPRYFPEPNQFDPQRFHPDREGEIPRQAYLPFGAGSRVCMGNAFAMMEAKIILAGVAQRYRLLLDQDEPVVPLPEITLHCQGGLQMKAVAQGR